MGEHSKAERDASAQWAFANQSLLLVAPDYGLSQVYVALATKERKQLYSIWRRSIIASVPKTFGNHDLHDFMPELRQTFEDCVQLRLACRGLVLFDLVIHVFVVQLVLQVLLILQILWHFLHILQHDV